MSTINSKKKKHKSKKSIKSSTVSTSDSSKHTNLNNSVEQNTLDRLNNITTYDPQNATNLY